MLTASQPVAPAEALAAPTPPPTPIRILVCDDHELVRRGIRRILEAEPDFDVVGEASDAASAVAGVAECAPRVVVMDVRMHEVSGIEACREIRSRFPATRVLMLTSFGDDDALFASIMAGAAGYVLKQIRGDALVAGIRHVAAGRSLLDPVVIGHVLGRLQDERPLDTDAIDELTSPERGILDLVAGGLSNCEIAARVSLPEKTVKRHLSVILAKLGMARRTQVSSPLARRGRDRTSPA